MTKPRPPNALEKMGLSSPIALALHLPSRYEDETALYSIEDALIKGSFSAVQTQGKVIRSQVLFRPRRQLVVTMEDDSAVLQLRFLNFYPSQQKQMAVGAHLRVRGEVRDGYSGPEMVHPSVKAVAPDAPLPASLTPVYPASEGVTQTAIRKAVQQALRSTDIKQFLAELIPATVTADLLPRGEWMPLHDAIHYLHNPPADADTAALMERTHPAWRRVQFEELLAQQLSLKQAHALRRQRNAPRLHADPSTQSSQSIEQGLLAALPFELTGAQKRVWAQIESDLSRAFPMNCLLQGDVGSGKTVVAALAAEGTSNVTNVQLISRGYERFIDKLGALGADFKIEG